MKNVYLSSTVLFLSAMIPAVAAATKPESRTLVVYTYGDLMNGQRNTETATGVKRYFYDHTGRLVRHVEAAIMLGDADGTTEIEVAGQEIPSAYATYHYNADGGLDSVTVRSYAVTGGYDRAWGTATTSERYVYDSEGRLTAATTATGTIRYEYEGDTLHQEIRYTAAGAWASTLTYVAFAEGRPDTALRATPDTKYTLFGKTYVQNNDRCVTFAYDSLGRKVEQVEYTIADGVKAETGDFHLLAYTLSTPYQQETWAYDGDRLTEYATLLYSSSSQTFVPSKKTAYTQTDDGWTETQSYAYNNSIGWTYFGTLTRTLATASRTAAPADLVADIGGDNRVRLTAATPATAATDETPVRIWRNGLKVGETVVADDSILFVDSIVPNGDWEYFVQLGDGDISDIVRVAFATPLGVAKDLCVTATGTDADGNYFATVAWTAPDVDAFSITGYNVYVDAADNPNAAPVNGIAWVTTTAYTFTWDSDDGPVHDICVETVYPIGKVRSAPFHVDATIPCAVERRLTADDTGSVAVYRIDGDCVCRAATVDRLSPSDLAPGMYIIRISTPSGTRSTKWFKQ